MMQPEISPPQKPLRVLKASSGLSFLPLINLREVWEFRDLLVTLAARDVKLRYRQAALGMAWALIQPIAGALVLWFIFSKMANLKTDSVPPFLFGFAGQVGYQAFSSTLSKGGQSLIQNAGLVSKVYFPRLILPLSTILSTFLDFGVNIILLGILQVAFGIGTHIGILTMPIWILLITLMAAGAGLMAGSLTALYRDVQYILPVITQLLTFAAPVAWSLTILGEKLSPLGQQAYLLLMPLSSLLQAFRWSLFGTGDLQWGYVAYASVCALLWFAGGVFVFQKLERRLADVI
jgi:lipopolysaccharide transport system permease protein